MIFNYNDIEQIVSESIIILSETMHVLNEKMFVFAEYIYDVIEHEAKRQNFYLNRIINSKIIKQYYPYRNPQDLGIITGFDNIESIIEFKPGPISYIEFNLNYFWNYSKLEMVSYIVHELTHYVNYCEGVISNINSIKETSLLTKYIRNIMYLLRDTECNARCSSFGYYLKNEENIKKIDLYEKLTHLNYIEEKLCYIEKNDTNNFLKKINGKNISYYRNKFLRYRKRILKI